MNSIHAQLERAEMMEAQARYLEQKGFRELFDLGCGAEWGDEDCGRCDCCALCSSEYAAYRLHIEHLLNDSKAGYEQCAQLLRKLVTAEPSEERIELLARALLDLDVHVYSQDKPAEELFWEVQYWYLHLYFTFGKLDFLEKAKQMEHFRGASIRPLNSAHYCQLPADN